MTSRAHRELRVILNADDFGASEDTVRATIDCFGQGALTSATVMVGMPATEAALAFARSHRDCSIGVHLVLVGDGATRPVSDPALVSGLVDGDGLLLPTNVVRLRALLGRLPVSELEREITAQIAYVRDAGIDVTHVDSHRHVHKLPAIREALQRTLPRLGIRRVRAVQDVYLKRPVLSPTYWLGRSWNRPLSAAFETTAHMYMPSSAHDVGWAEALLERCRRLAGGTLEVGVHPGSLDEWRDEERRSALSFAAAARDAGHELISWRDL